MIVFGAIDFAAALTRRVGVFWLSRHPPPRAAGLAACGRSQQVDDVVVDSPHRYLAAQLATGRVDGRTAIAVLTHDAKLDAPLREVAPRVAPGRGRTRHGHGISPHSRRPMRSTEEFDP